MADDRAVLTRPIAQGVLAVWAFAFIGFFGTHATTFEPGLRLAAATIFGAPVVLFALVLLLRTSHPLDGALIVLLAVYGVVCLLSTDQTASLETLLLAVMYASVFVISIRRSPAWVQQGLAVGTAFAATVWLVFFAVLWTSGLLAWSSATGTFPSFLGRSGNLWLSIDAVGALVLVAAPYYFLIGRATVRRVLLLVSGLASVLVLPLTDARTAWFAIGVAAAVFWLTGRGRVTGIRRHLPLVAVSGVGVAIAAVALVASEAVGTLSGRTFVWRTAVAVIEHHPVAGAGPGTFSWVRLAEAPELMNRYPVYHAHNLILQLLADGGLLLLVGFGVFVLGYCHHVFSQTDRLSRAARAGLASVIGFGIILMADELTQVPALTAMAVYSAGMVAREGAPASGVGGSRRMGAVLAATMVGCLVLAMPASLAAHAARTSAEIGREKASEADWSQAWHAFSAASDAWPARAAYQLALGQAEANLGARNRAKTHYARAHQLSPGDPRALGAMASLSRDRSERIDLLRQASRLGSQDPQYSLRLAAELAAEGDRAAAAREWARASLLDPQLLAVPELREIGLEVADVVGMLDDVIRDEAGLIGVDGAAIRAQGDLALGQMPEDSPVLSAIGLAMAGEPAAAYRDITAGLVTTPHDRPARKAAIAIARLLCRDADVERHDRLLNMLGGESLELYAPVGPPGESADNVYREMGLGDYQPPWVADPPVHRSDWPAGFLPPPECE